MPSVIYGSDLINAHTDLAPKFRDMLDPEGFNLVTHSFLHNDGPDYRLMCLFKVRDSDEPVEGPVTLSGRDFGKIVKQVTI